MIEEAGSRLKLLEILAGSEGMTVPGSALAEALGLSRQAAFKLVTALRGEGVAIESIPQKGYALHHLKETDALSATLVDYLLRQDTLFTKCHCYAELESTQTAAKKLAQDDAPGGVIVTAESQTRGRGRRGRTWVSPVGENLYFSTVLRPRLKPGEVQLLNLAAGVAVRDTLRHAYEVAAELKWPNDVLVGGKKICGILSESAGEVDKIYYAVTGIGVNVNTVAADFPPELRATATSMRIEKDCLFARPLLLCNIFRRFSELMQMLENSDHGGAGQLIRIYRESCDMLGKEIRVIQDEEEYTGRALDVTEQGALIVEVQGKKKIFAAADVQHLRTKK